MRRALLLCPLLCLGLSASPAQAAYDPIGAGATKLVLDPSFAAFLKADGIELKARAGARRRGSAFTLPVSGGNLDPTLGNGEIDNGGSLVFEDQRKRVPLRQITVKTKPAPLIAKVGGSQLKLTERAKPSFKREGFDSSFTAKAMRLTAKLATRLDKKLRPKVPFRAGQLMGALSSKASPKLVTIKDSGRATLLFDSAFLAKLESRFVSLNPIHPAEHSGPSFSFPLAIGGQIAPDGSQGTLRTGGALELLQLGGAQLFWQEQWLDLGAHADSAEADLEPTPAFPGKLGRLPIFEASPGSLGSDPRTRTISASGISLTLGAEGARELNQAFGEGGAPFGVGEAVGSLSFSAVGE